MIAEVTMQPDETPSRLSRIETMWSVVQRAHGGDPKSLATAQQQLLELYGNSIRRYLLAATRDPQAADDLFQDFAVRFINGEFQAADPTRGRFRSFVKTILSRMVALHFRRRSRRRETRMVRSMEATSEPAEIDGDDALFLAAWREELLAGAWEALAQHERQTGSRYNTVLRLRVAHPELDGRELAERVSRELDKPMEPGAVRVMIHRAREKFATLLTTTVAESMGSRNRDVVEAELIELGLIDYCRDALSALPVKG